MATWTRDAMGSREDLRLVPEAALHVTLVFLGSVESEQVRKAWEATAQATERHAAPMLRASGVTGLPRRRPRLFALSLSDVQGRAGALHDAVAAGLGAAGLYEPEGRRFWPHVTVARVRRGERAVRVESEAPAIEPFAASQLTLYRSRPGSDYEALSRLELASP